MSGNHTDDGSSVNTVDSLVRGLLEAWPDDHGRATPSPATEAEPVIRAQLVENTGRHLLDSGGAYGRAWEENQESPPWDDAAWNVDNGYVTHNVYDFMAKNFFRDETAVGLESALYAWSYRDGHEDEGWLSCMEGFGEALCSGEHTDRDLEDLGVPSGAAVATVNHQYEVLDDHNADYRQPDEPQPMTHNTYNDECHTLSQCIQYTTLGGPYAEYGLVQVHGGCDIRGGYTAPRVYRTYDGITPHELEFVCTECDWIDHESCLYGSDELLYQRTVDRGELVDTVVDRADDGTDAAGRAFVALSAADDAEDTDHVDGAVFHVGDACGGRVRFH